MSKGLQMKYFVLNPSKQDAYGKASRSAMLLYAISIEEENKELASDLRQWVHNLEDVKTDESAS